MFDMIDSPMGVEVYIGIRGSYGKCVGPLMGGKAFIGGEASIGIDGAYGKCVEWPSNK